MTLRVMPTVGAEVVIEHLGATQAGLVSRVGEGGRRLEVTTEDGRRLGFALNRATARFTAGGELTGARLRFTGAD